MTGGGALEPEVLQVVAKWQLCDIDRAGRRLIDLRRLFRGDNFRPSNQHFSGHFNVAGLVGSVPALAKSAEFCYMLLWDRRRFFGFDNSLRANVAICPSINIGNH